ncbi:MAG TPA: TetR/AcrR family transcriptional regulator [Candidatus Limnocylindrales bacterium]|jgi:AcrR family transcriptional regulator
MNERLSRQERKAQTRERLLDAAAQVFAQRGFEAASLDEVAAAAGYTKGAVYSNFAGKTDLLIALLERRIDVQSAEYAHRFEGRDAEEIARDLLKPADHMSDSEKQFLVLLVEFWLHAMHDERARVLIAEQYERARTVVGKLLVDSGYEKLVTEPKLEPRDMAIVIEALGTGLAMQAALDPERVRLGLEAEVMVKLLRLPDRPDADRAMPPAKPDPAESAVD